MIQDRATKPYRTMDVPIDSNVAGHIYVDLIKHIDKHTSPNKEIFDKKCGECIYWAAKVIQNPTIWQKTYIKKQKQYLRQVPFEDVTSAIEEINKHYSLQMKAYPWRPEQFIRCVLQ